MQLTFLGHAGFLVETAHAVVVVDPWLSPTGAFDSAWMQFPCNHHLASRVRQVLRTSPKQRFLYISHEHKDHFDVEFLRTLGAWDFTVVAPRFRRPVLREALVALGARRLVTCEDKQEVSFPEGYLKLYLTDTGTNRDSALLVQAERQSFLNLNDCKVHDRLARVVEEEGPVDVFTAQFSGAIWHPTCYEYTPEVYAELSRRKRASKFEAVARALSVVKPRVYLASAGPACFLDPELRHLHAETVNIFPRAPEFFTYVRQRLGEEAPRLEEPMPGDVLDVGRGEWAWREAARLTEQGLEEYLEVYASRQAHLFRARRRNMMKAEAEQMLARLGEELRHKVEAFAGCEQVTMPLYLALKEVPGRLLRVDFAARGVEEVPRVKDERRYLFTAGAWDVGRVLERKLTWEDFLLSFRFRISRTPDVYDAALHNFLAGEVEDLRSLGEEGVEPQARSERMVVAAGNQRYSLQRFCPHQGADLKEGWVEEGRFLVCPRHRWRFDLEDGGRCPLNGASVRAEPVGEKEKPRSGPAEVRA